MSPYFVEPCCVNSGLFLETCLLSFSTRATDDLPRTTQITAFWRAISDILSLQHAADVARLSHTTRTLRNEEFTRIQQSFKGAASDWFSTAVPASPLRPFVFGRRKRGISDFDGI